METSSLKVPQIKELQKVTLYSKPKELAHFSYSPSRELLFNDSALQYYKPKKVPINLNSGYPENYIKRTGDIEPLDSMLLAVKDQPKNVHFCTWRGIMTKIICTPYSLNEGWELVATKYNGTIYLMEHETTERHAKKVQYDNADLFTYYGYRFEAECTSDGKDVIVNTNVQYCSVFTSKLGSFHVLMGAEVDCLYEKPLEGSDIQSQYTELKTHKVMNHPRQETSFVKFKLLKTWAQSFLVGVSKVIFGFRTEDGFIQNIKTYRTDEFPRMARKERLWDPNVCLTFGQKTLEFLQEKITIDDMNTTYIIKYSPETRSIEVNEPDKDGSDIFIHKGLF